ncbi:MAG: hypothetical protein A2268_10905 [Candidatus Raymondbacteria bacterium RifOxyA12_full_50_37]|uniref:Uncharacterized protein n=1 Tax=Candidatus Raymondbacteria bacterium RIFOXYD12_FULL_49_13 TaxID=1817890 RepID=A0A1F7F2C6_UNCRA|nr:MAG: hypothetical protein A2268_10905 [Candidatus Raymondbacteria bacterium RifOxyA12_full_50_37]OGJ85520.1 MAG: hypothetical protein A2248_12690 [Candidatus Raymondbacteria bacterium RIFOXYA2_FULL_49_16]OGJ95023.1 MAG: hypothetical protein A2453_07390 [Candidatus Raymondbacteria bacterium RIFOXYC2_FULL_50_21]OGK00687.1 MAG: hypothetical protein A2519_20025 [Candidatus Raymondbacteria bacterium RIFOXYD12_FULL_49_13]OGK01291.1 MAG: hypothetical protein A2350_08385 [Candidatus Raymondbacteria 
MKHSVILIPACLLLLVNVGCSKGSKQKPESITDIQKREGVPVTVVKVQRTAIQDFETAGGTVEGISQTTMVCPTPGVIAEIYVSVGQSVAAGAQLMRIEPDGPSSLDITQAQYEQAQKSLERMTTLAEEGGVSQEALDQVKTGYAAAKATYSAAKRSETLFAPFAGIVANIYKPVRDRADRNIALLELAVYSKVKVKMQVSDALINKFKKGQKARAILGSDTLSGTVTLVSLAGQEMTHVFPVEALFANPDRILKPGMFVTVQVAVDERANALVLPMETVISEGKSNSVFVVSADKLASKRQVVLGIRGGNEYEIISGVQEGESVVTTGSSLLTEATLVKIVN